MGGIKLILQSPPSVLKKDEWFTDQQSLCEYWLNKEIVEINLTSKQLRHRIIQR